MTNKYATLIGRIKQELSEIEESVKRSKKAWEKAYSQSDPLYLDSVALNLHDFYSGLERIFEVIAENIDGVKLGGSNWHQELLKQMSMEVSNVRPNVLSIELRHGLDEYRAFRHVVRNVYAHNFKADRMGKLVDNIEKVFSESKKELLAFCNFLEGV